MATNKKNDWLNNDFIDKVNASNAEKLPGQTDELYERAHETFKKSDESLDNYETVKKSKSNLNNLVNKEEIISSDVKETMNSQFNKPTSVKQADRYLASQLEKIQSGRTSYSDQVRDMMDKIMNREKFSYDVDNDPLFQQALASATNSGKQAMQDTIGQASALTGGYGSTYATSAGNQAYNSFIEDAYDNLPQYYQMALDAYQMEGEEMYRQFGVVSEMDDKEFNRNVAAYDATYQHRNQMYNEAYGEFRDTKNDAFNMANLQLNEHGQRVSDAYNLYNADLAYADSMYEKEYTQWADKVNLAWKETELLYDNAWNEKNMEFQDEWNQKNYDQNEDHFTRGQEFTASENQKQRDWQTSEAQKDRDFTASENAKNRAASTSRSGSGGGNDYKLSTSEINGLLEAYNEGGVDSVMAFLGGIGKSPTDDYSLSIVENILAQEDIRIDNATPKSGTVSQFRTTKGDNFNVKVGDKYYAVENKGKVDNTDTIEGLKKLKVNNGTAFNYDGNVYVKQGDGYFKVGGMMFGGKNYEELLKALQK